MRTALVQVASPQSEPGPERRERVAAMVADAAGADLVVLPELWLPGYFAFGSYPEFAEPLDGDTVTAAREWARRLGCHLHMGSVLERARDGRLYNTAVLIGPDGEIAHTYRKIHVFGYRSREAELLTPGDRVATVPTDLGRLGTTTCYDLRFPELYRALADQGAESVVVCSAWPLVRLAHWRLFTSVRAVEEQVVLIACNAVGEQAGSGPLGGHSRVVDPWGEVLVEAGTDEGITWCDVDTTVVAKARAEFPVLADRRLDLPVFRSTSAEEV
ncbi:carbon-nitrogen family hydrolase [Actinomadura roseirufa]|uniref:carbon-nitrogen family hydrolase n=1 Tax=Actinomadura roseirufa TaxID=2094049 RepID=UPI001041B2AB|nr:carbon-nitrogen family hydrolase [Actinomadura roseirufa]